MNIFERICVAIGSGCIGAAALDLPESVGLTVGLVLILSTVGDLLAEIAR